jgi:hypothetical protein
LVPRFDGLPMTGRATVHELETTATVTLAVPRERGGELRAVATEHLEAIDFVRSAAVVEQGAVDAHEDGLSVTCEADLTLHFGEPVDGEEARARLAAEVAALDDFDVLSGPYEIEAW